MERLRLACSRRGVTVIMVIVVGFLAATDIVEGDHLHKVGGSKMWNENVNYTEWSAHQRFYVGDWLYFVFDKRYYNVLEVSKTSYEKCNDQGFMKNITRGGRDVFQLTEARPYYFLSSGGYCFHGMRVSVSVELLPPTPAPAPTSLSDSPPKAITTPHLLTFVLLSIASVLWLINHL